LQPHFPEIPLKRNLLALSVFASLGVLASTHAGAATNMFDATVSTATKLDATAVTLNGTLHDTNGNSQPWTTQVYAQAGECLRLFVTSTSFDAKLEVIAPDGEVFRDDDSGGSLRPLVKIASAPNFGWYTVQVAQFDGTPLTADFTMKYGRYNNGNPNCATPTNPLAIVGAALESVKDPMATAPAQPRAPYAP
jgi:hypothetical protein